MVNLPPDQCIGTATTTPKRVVRLTENQMASSYVSLFGQAAATNILKDEVLPDLAERPFPPLAGNPGINEGMATRADRMAKSAMAYVAGNLATVSGCAGTPDAACGQAFIQSFAEKAYRRPLTNEEKTSFTTLWTELTANGNTPAEAIPYGVYAALTGPGFLYRTEFGQSPASDGALSPHELASQISYFLTDAPPDAALTAAATGNQLSTPEQVKAQVARLLATPAARENLEMAMMTYFSLPGVVTLALDPGVITDFTVNGGVLASMYREAQLFMQNTLWAGPLSGLLTGTKTWVKSDLATPIYGVAAPTQVDADGFGQIDLPADRAGLLTLAPFLTSRTRPTGASVVGRALSVNAALVCQVNPPFPEDDPTVAAAIEATHELSEKEQYEFRKSTPTCSTCHSAFDAFGMVLEPYDGIGRHRTKDPKGNNIDAAWTTSTLPERLGGGQVSNAKELAKAMLDSGTLNRCMAMNFMNFALADVTQGGANVADSQYSPTASCAVKAVLDRFMTTDQSFTSLVQEIVVSETLMLRSKGM
jgi:hypothetical protein